MGINVNVSPRIQQNTPLRTVRSGATEEPDNNVKYVPQTLTEAQQAQARQNIGAISASEVPASAQANWNETDTESPAYIQNKPTIPAAQVQADWNQSDDTAVDYIKNKPSQSLELTMTDEDGNVITGTFILSSKTIVPAS